ncbi:MAG TPA: 2-dehydropantoate 2-reductase [Epsilonproteobacteria bacterium]|nr:2-dehydropantoate 2-reductase [Campylobacterota bacterium]
MRIAIVGIGGVGGYIGARLCSLIGTQKQKYEILFIARGTHAEAVKKNGIVIREDHEEFRAHPTGVCLASEAEGTFDLILVCVKSYDMVEALIPLKHTMRTDTVVIPFANGVNHAQLLNAHFDAKVVNGCVYILSHIAEPGVIRKKGNLFAAVFGSETYSGECLHIYHIFKDAGLRAKVEEDIDRAVWKKYLFISAFATLTSYYDETIRTVYESHPAESVALLKEITSVAQAKGIDITEEIDKALTTASSLPETASTSMHLDFRKHRQTELETLSGYIVEEAVKYGVAVPWMQEMYEALKCR